MKFGKILAAAAVSAAVAAPALADGATAPKMNMDEVVVSTQNFGGESLIVPLILFYMLIMALSSNATEVPPAT
jgi:hypothetical protein